MTPIQVIDEFRSQVDDKAQPYLWPSDEALRYLIDAQDRMVRGLGGIADVTVAAGDVGSPATRLPDLVLTSGSPYSAVSQYVVRIRSGRLISAARDVKFANEADMAQARVQDYGWTTGLTFDDAKTGDVRYGVLGVREDYVRWMDVPAANDTCRLHIKRLPYPRLPTVLDQLDDEALEVHEEHHLELVSWMKYLAYSKQDAEAYDPKKAETCRAAFVAYVDRARREQERRQFKPRVVQYGGL